MTKQYDTMKSFFHQLKYTLWDNTKEGRREREREGEGEEDGQEEGKGGREGKGERERSLKKIL